MAFIPVANTAQCELIYNYQGQICQNVLHFEYVSTVGGTELVNLANDLISWYTASIAVRVNDQVELTGVVAIDMTAQNAEAVEVGASVTGSRGTPTVNPLPNNVTVAVKKVTGLRGRSYRGRLYHVGLDDAQVSGNVLDSTTASGFASGYNALVVYPWTDTGWTYVVVSKYSGNAPRTAGVTTPVLSHTVDLTIDSQRRRLPGRGQ